MTAEYAGMTAEYAGMTTEYTETTEKIKDTHFFQQKEDKGRDKGHPFSCPLSFFKEELECEFN